LWHGWNTLPQGSTRHEGPDDEMRRTTPLISLLNESFNMLFESDVVAFCAAPSWRYMLSKNRRDPNVGAFAVEVALPGQKGHFQGSRIESVVMRNG
jgi:hypothetical protein